jgi:peptidoglycan/LPS O-acetylase OafA/YrhL
VKPKFSVYLDIVRFLAALMVFIGHAAGMEWTGGLFWQAGGYGDTCVVIFFILSGYVIAYVTEIKEKSWWVYGANRIARIWSVVIPALVLTFIIDYIGVRMAPELYIGRPWFNGDNLWLRYLVSFFQLQEAWHIGYAPGINQPFWSLSYEVFYYLIFGLCMFCSGKTRVILVCCVCALGGPLVVALLPLWMIGVYVYRRSGEWKIPRLMAAALFALSLVLLAFSPSIRQVYSFKLMGQEVLGRYLDAFAFVMNLIAAHRLLDQDRPLPFILHNAIKKVASTTFVLYLFHRPLMQFFSYAGPADPSSWERRLLVIGATLVVVALATPLCDRFQKYLRGLCLRWMTPQDIHEQARLPGIIDESLKNAK